MYLNETIEMKRLARTHAIVHWLVDPDKSGQAVHLAGFAPAFTLSVGGSGGLRKETNTHNLGR